MILERLDLAFSRGFNVLTGETVAGKSIVIDAVNAILGARTGTEVVRTGADLALVEGVFDVSEPLRKDDGLRALLDENGLETEDGLLLLGREIHRQGRSVARVAGRAVPVRLLQQMGEFLVDVHGQGEQQSLLRVSSHIDLLDTYGGLPEQRGRVAERVAALRELQRELKVLQDDERALVQRADLLRFQVNEIQAARLQSGEEADLGRERAILANAERLAAASDTAYRSLVDFDDGRAATDCIGHALAALAEACKIDVALQEQSDALQEALYQLEEAGRALRSYRDGVEFNPERLQDTEDRLHLIRTLKRKYGDSIEAIFAFGARAADELDKLSHRSERIEELQSRDAELREEIGRLAAELSSARRKAGERLAAGVETELAELGMAHARFAVAVDQTEAGNGVPIPDGRTCGFGASGIDRVEFLLAANPGESLKPLARTASGGETSRLMLALKSVLSQADSIPTLIFDEVDAGIGGRGGEIVGRKLWALTHHHQVLCVSHLSQIACLADSHYHVSKSLKGERTVTSVRKLEGDERVQEVAAMLGGVEDSVLSRLNAGDLLQRAQEWKNGSGGGRGVPEASRSFA